MTTGQRSRAQRLIYELIFDTQEPLMRKSCLTSPDGYATIGV